MRWRRSDPAGDGSPLPNPDENVSIAAGDLTDANGDNPLLVVNAYGSIYGTGLPDLLAINGDPVNAYYLDYYGEFLPGGFINTFSIHTPTPDGTQDWTLATLSCSGGIGHVPVEREHWCLVLVDRRDVHRRNGQELWTACPELITRRP
jgi:hypothetical protein